MTRLLPLLACLLLISATAEAGPDPATKADPGKTDGPVVRCTIRSIHGLQTAGGLDKRLSFLKRQFSKPPFSAYKTLKLLDARELELPQGVQQKVTLPNGKIVKLTFKERLLGRKDRLKLRMSMSITPPKEKRFLPAMVFTIINRGTLLVAGDKHKDGTLVVGVTCQTK